MTYNCYQIRIQHITISISDNLRASITYTPHKRIF